MISRVALVAAILLLVASSASAGGRKLADDELDSVTAAGYTIAYRSGTPENTLFDFNFDHTGQAKHVSGQGSLDISTHELGALSLNSLVIDHGAQQGLKALVNINAVNAVVNVLMNLVINVDSTVIGGITQWNGVRH
jgi:hypothetical protein